MHIWLVFLLYELNILNPKWSNADVIQIKFACFYLKIMLQMLYTIIIYYFNIIL